MLRLVGYRSSIAAEKRCRRRVLMDNGGLRRRLKPRYFSSRARRDPEPVPRQFVLLAQSDESTVQIDLS